MLQKKWILSKKDFQMKLQPARGTSRSWRRNVSSLPMDWSNSFSNSSTVWLSKIDTPILNLAMSSIALWGNFRYGFQKKLTRSLIAVEIPSLYDRKELRELHGPLFRMDGLRIFLWNFIIQAPCFATKDRKRDAIVNFIKSVWNASAWIPHSRYRMHRFRLETFKKLGLFSVCSFRN